jgi:hypothetical protein
LVSIFVTLPSRIYKGGQGPLSKEDLWIILHQMQYKPLQDIGYYAPSGPNLSKLCVPYTFEFLISAFLTQNLPPWVYPSVGSRLNTDRDDMFYRTLEGLLLKCLGPVESNRLLLEVHEGTCGTHQSAHKMKWLIRRSGYYWPTMLEDCFKYYKGCQACQRFGKI